MIRTAILATAAALALTSTASAQAVSGVSFDAGAGLRYSPDYVGSEDYDASPWLILRNLSFSADAAGRPSDGFYISPSADYVGKRDFDEDDDLYGLDEIDGTVELGVKAGYRFGQVNTYAGLRKGLGGHKGVVGEVGLKYTMPVSQKLTVTTGLEAQYGNSTYMDAYFGVSPEEALRTGFDTFEPSSGFRSVSAEVEMRYQATENWAVLGQIRAGKLIGDAADSPVVEKEEQYSVGLGVVRHFSFRF